jgi:hypothetical protein
MGSKVAIKFDENRFCVLKIINMKYFLREIVQFQLELTWPLFECQKKNFGYALKEF